MRVLVTGATGFLGRHVVAALRSQGHQVRCLVHTPGREALLQNSELDVHYGSVGDLDALRAAIYELDAVVHLVAVIREKGLATFDAINHQGTKNVASVAAEAGVRHFIHVSALGAQDNPLYPYLYSKWLGEQGVRSCGIPYTIVRPSILFGEADQFINTLAGLVRAFPAVPVAGSGANPFQPIAVEDAARCIAATIGNEDFMGRTAEIGGPQQLSYEEIIQVIARTLGLKRAVVPVPLPLMRGLARVMEAVVPSPPVTAEQLRMVTLPNVTETDSVSGDFGFQPRSLEGNIDFVKNITLWDGLRIATGFMPARAGGD